MDESQDREQVELAVERRRVAKHQQEWVRSRIAKAIEMAVAVHSLSRLMGDRKLVDAAVDGLVNAATEEVIRAVGRMPHNAVEEPTTAGPVTRRLLTMAQEGQPC